MTSDPGALMYRIEQVKEDIDRVTAQLNGGQPFFRGPLSLRKPKFYPAELGLIRTVSFFYVLYYEVGKVNIEFVRQRLSTYRLDPTGERGMHFELVGRLRTFFQHNLDPQSQHDAGIQQDCERWFEVQCGTREPYDEPHWESCLIALLEQAHRFLDAVRECIREIEQDESRAGIVSDWAVRRTRYHPPEQFDELMSKVAADMGRDAVDVPRLRKRFYDRWVKEIGTRQGTYDFNTEARKLIEHALMNEVTQVLPITGHDIMAEFGINPGRQVGELLDKARTIYDASPGMKKEQLLARLRHEILLPHTA